MKLIMLFMYKLFHREKNEILDSENSGVIQHPSSYNPPPPDCYCAGLLV